MEYLQNLRIVLLEPTHPGNIGAVARSMKTMGLSRLILVNPKKFPHSEATRRAASADNLLRDALVVKNLKLAIGDCTLVLGTSVRDREISWPTLDPRQAAEQIIGHLRATGQTPVESQQAAILFGRESNGLSNHELDQCHAQIRIPANEEYSSLNLASAVQIVAYELRMFGLLKDPQEQDDLDSLTPAAIRRKRASVTQCTDHIVHLQRTLEQLDFIKSNPPTMLMRKLTRLYNKAQLSVEEIQILRGILTAIDTHTTRFKE